MILKRSTLSMLMFELNTENKETYLTIKDREIIAASTNNFITRRG
jgi:hypothetical protein